MTYRTSRWFRRVLTPRALLRRNLPEIRPTELPIIVDDCWVREDLLVAPVLKHWFVYTPMEERDTPVRSRNYTGSDIRWFLKVLTAPPGSESVGVRVRQDQVVCWSRIPELCDPIIPARADPQHEWIVYIAWVHYILSRKPTVQKEGRIRMGYQRWYDGYFKGQEDPLGLC